ncbi:MAG: C25 family cysteine peptidase [Planctomycetales bacterium]|nr:C25 family cysteine peptidase [Planctomycetales bacterium]
MRALSLLVVAALFPPPALVGSPYRIADPAAPQRVDWLVVAGDSFADRLDALAAHREKQGLRPGIVSMTDLRAKFPGVREFVAHAVESWEKPAPKYLLLAGDVEAVPAVVRPGAGRGFQSEADLATDFDYACPAAELEPALHVGRLPCDTPEELDAMIRKILDYETTVKPGAWQKKVAFVVGEAGFGPELDAFIEKQFIQIVGGGLPAAYDIEVAYASPRSPYCPFPPKFDENAVRLLNEGSLFYVFVGHGSRSGVDRIRWRQKSYDILNEAHAGKVETKNGLPIMVVIACSTGHYDHEGDCVGEVFLKRPRGPVAFLGGSRVTQPYANGLIGKALVDQSFGDAPSARTLGEAVTRAKKQVLAHGATPFHQQADFMAAMVQGKEALEPMRRDVVRHYNLLGDPALVLRKPEPSIRISVKGNVATIEAAAPEVALTLECAREKSARPLPPADEAAPDFERKVVERYRVANDRVMKSWKVRLAGGRATQKIELPKAPGKYWLKAYAPGAIGSAEVEVESD